MHFHCLFVFQFNSRFLLLPFFHFSCLPFECTETRRRVHISERTLSFLNGEFEVTDGDGASREEAIRLSGVKTYLIVKVIKPVSANYSVLPLSSF